MTKTQQRTCPECVHDNGWHFTDDLIPKPYRCPNYLAADQQAEAIKLTAEAHKAQFLAAKQIVHDAAQTLPEFSQNNIRHLFDDAGITDRQVIGAAFNALANCKSPPIESTGRRVPSQDEATHGHGIVVWRSLTYRGQVAS